MAPALPAAPDPPRAASDPRRRALASVHNTLMEDDDMQLQPPNHSKEALQTNSQDMEQMLDDLGTSDLLQAFRTIETGAEVLSTSDDAIFPLSGFDLNDKIDPDANPDSLRLGFDLPDPALDSEGDGAEEKIRLVQAQLERRCAFLLRRLRIYQARAIGKRISEESAQIFEKCLRGSRKDGCGRTSGLKALLKRVETTAALQASAASRSVIGPKYFNAGTSKGDPSRSASVGIPSGTLAGLEDTAGALRSHLTVVKHELDSDATLSSSGAESNDEGVLYNNPHKEHMPVEKRALWSWQRARASIASRWGWLQAQVQELEYKIRQHADLHKQVRTAKGPVEFEGEPAAYLGPLPGDDCPADDPRLDSCARVRPLKRDTFRKRKLLQMHNLHVATAKAAKPADIRCSCQFGWSSCCVCTGRAAPTEPLPPPSTLPPSRALALADPGYHPVLSDIKDVSPSMHMATLSALPWFRSRCLRARPPRPAPPPRAAHPPPAPAAAAGPQPRVYTPPRGRDHRLHKKERRLKRGRPPLSRRVRERERESHEDLINHERARARASTESRQARLTASYDIDNIVIPQSVAANTRPEILHYKEIVTPKWRVMDMPDAPLNNGVSKSHPRYSHHMSDSEDEDISEARIRERHQRSEAGERARFLRKPRHRRRATDDAPLTPEAGAAPGPGLPAEPHEASILSEAGERARFLRKPRHRRRATDDAPLTPEAGAAPGPGLPAEPHEASILSEAGERARFLRKPRHRRRATNDEPLTPEAGAAPGPGLPAEPHEASILSEAGERARFLRKPRHRRRATNDEPLTPEAGAAPGPGLPAEPHEASILSEAGERARFLRKPRHRRRATDDAPLTPEAGAAPGPGLPAEPHEASILSEAGERARFLRKPRHRRRATNDEPLTPEAGAAPGPGLPAEPHEASILSEAGERARFLRKPRHRRRATNDEPLTPEAGAAPGPGLPAEPHEASILSEAGERARFLRKPRHRRRATNDEPLTPEAGAAPGPGLPAEPHEIVAAYSPRRFPLPDAAYSDMLAAMPDGHRQGTPDPEPGARRELESSSSLSPLSPLVFEGDDPDDAEWAPDPAARERRRAHYR